jgi:hypothetical protein
MVSTANPKEGSMTPVRRTAGALSHQVYGAWRRACLRQAGQLNCNPVGIIAALAVMVGTVELWNHSHDIGLWVLLLGGPVAIALVTLAIVRLLQPLTVVAGLRPRHRSAPESQPRPVSQRRPALPPAGPPAPGPVASEIGGVPSEEDILVLQADSSRRLEQAGRVQEPV